MKNLQIIIILFLITQNINAEESLSLSSAIHITIRNNKGLLASQKKVESKDELISSAYGRYLPTINFDIKYNYMDRDIVLDLDPIRSAMIEIQSGNQVGFSNLESLMKTGNQLTDAQKLAIKQGAGNSLNDALPHFIETVQERAFPKASLSFSQPIFTGGKITAGVDAASAQKDLENEKYYSERDELIISTINIYLNVQLAKENLKVRNEVLKAVENHKLKAEVLLKQGLIAANDKLRADVAYSEAKRNQFEAEELLKISLIALNSQLDTNDIDSISDSLNYKENEVNIDEFLPFSKNNNHILKQLQAGCNAMKEKANAEFANFFPTVFGFGQYDIFDNYRSVIEPKWVVGVGANFVLFNGLRRSHDYQSSLIEAESMVYLTNEVERKIQLAIRKTYMQMKLAEYQYLMLSTALSEAKENTRLNEKRYESGLGTSLESLDAQVTLEGVQLKRMQSLKDYYNNISLLYQYAGKTDEFIEFWNK